MFLNSERLESDQLLIGSFTQHSAVTFSCHHHYMAVTSSIIHPCKNTQECYLSSPLMLFVGVADMCDRYHLPKGDNVTLAHMGHWLVAACAPTLVQSMVLCTESLQGTIYTHFKHLLSALSAGGHVSTVEGSFCTKINAKVMLKLESLTMASCPPPWKDLTHPPTLRVHLSRSSKKNKGELLSDPRQASSKLELGNANIPSWSSPPKTKAILRDSEEACSSLGTTHHLNILCPRSPMVLSHPVYLLVKCICVRETFISVQIHVWSLAKLLHSSKEKKTKPNWEVSDIRNIWDTF